MVWLQRPVIVPEECTNSALIMSVQQDLKLLEERFEIDSIAEMQLEIYK